MLTNKNKDLIDSLVTEKKQPLNNTYVAMPRSSAEWTSYSSVQKKKTKQNENKKKKKEATYSYTCLKIPDFSLTNMKFPTN